MSILMDALKQQTSGPQAVLTVESPPAAAPRTPLWFILAGVLVLGAGIGCGLWLDSIWRQAAPDKAADTIAASASVAPSASVVAANSQAATPSLVLQDILAMPTAEELEAQEPETLPEHVISVAENEDEDELAGGTVLGASANTGFGAERSMREANLDDPVTDYQPETKDFGSLPARELNADEVPQALRDKFQFAIDSLKDSPKAKVQEYAAPARDIQTLDDVIQRQIPPIRFQAHVYASEPRQRWVKVNGKDLQEGQWITADIQLKEITPQYVLLQTGRQLFSMPALSEWSYRLKTP